MLSPRLGTVLLGALLAGCASTTHEPETVPPPVIELTPVKAERRAEPDSQAEEESRQIAENAGILSALAEQDVADVFAPIATEEESALGGLVGTGSGLSAGGLGLRGTGPGGGGTGDSTLGIGTIGHGGGAGNGYGVGKGSNRVRVGAASVKGSLDKEMIHRIVRQRVNQVKYCYEKQLAKTPNLEGRIALKFVIDKEGAVTRADVESGMQADVDACVAKVVRSMSFPKPKGGGVVVVKYPFIFKQADGTPKAGQP